MFLTDLKAVLVLALRPIYSENRGFMQLPCIFLPNYKHDVIM